MRNYKAMYIVLGAACIGLLVGIMADVFVPSIKLRLFLFDPGTKILAVSLALILGFSRVRGWVALSALAASVDVAFLVLVVLQVWAFRSSVFWDFMQGSSLTATWGWPSLWIPMQALALAVPAWFITNAVRSARESRQARSMVQAPSMAPAPSMA